jgi:hypothetical protein
MIKKASTLLICTLLFTASLQVRLSHDNKKGYSYIISGPSLEEVLEADQKMKQYLKSQSPKKNAVLPPSAPAPKPVPQKK